VRSSMKSSVKSSMEGAPTNPAYDGSEVPGAGLEPARPRRGSEV